MLLDTLKQHARYPASGFGNYQRGFCVFRNGVLRCLHLEREEVCSQASEHEQRWQQSDSSRFHSEAAAGN